MTSLNGAAVLVTGANGGIGSHFSHADSAAPTTLADELGAFQTTEEAAERLRTLLTPEQEWADPRRFSSGNDEYLLAAL